MEAKNLKTEEIGFENSSIIIPIFTYDEDEMPEVKQEYIIKTEQDPVPKDRSFLTSEQENDSNATELSLKYENYEEYRVYDHINRYSDMATKENFIKKEGDEFETLRDLKMEGLINQGYDLKMMKKEEECSTKYMHHPRKVTFDIKVEVISKSTQDTVKAKKVKPQPQPNSCRPSKINPNKVDSYQNILKNYARAFTKFALSPMSLRYSKPRLELEGMTLSDFHDFIYERRDDLTCLRNIREILLIKNNDNDKIRSAKRVFCYLCEIFLKFFAVNWLYSSRIDDKLNHLSYRFKILRRVRQPQYFTYLQGFKKKKNGVSNR